jgi:hypothetical protein
MQIVATNKVTPKKIDGKNFINGSAFWKAAAVPRALGLKIKDRGKRARLQM